MANSVAYDSIIIVVSVCCFACLGTAQSPAIIVIIGFRLGGHTAGNGKDKPAGADGESLSGLISGSFVCSLRRSQCESVWRNERKLSCGVEFQIRTSDDDDDWRR